MRLWTIHPKYLDKKGFVAVWREALLAKKVLQKRTRGYKNHPQLIRFKNQDKPLLFINTYLFYIWEEAKKRGYSFNKKKINKKTNKKINTTTGQIVYEFKHLKNKLKTREPIKFRYLKKVLKIKPNPIFKIKKGEREFWEKV
ncbi:pyrimidine dimer DNA glycosylase/endonuclease V [Candidatus Micrarchaeota archaeon]|nr:pyrimidine dimer DNA glycosylase/endonuclease V [Candidatus Micrarchaeota archaeon]